MDLIKSWILRWGPAVAIMIIIFALSAVPSYEMPNFGSVDTLVKKLGHATGYALLTMAYARGLKVNSLRILGMCWLLMIVYALSDEFHQAFVSGRNSSLVDVGIDSVGGLAAIACLLSSATLRKWIRITL